ncbi:HAMP domain-containing sensor histidine kinase [Streptomyces sp. G-G2]|uniref:sensor histidine kinase n=1 Tax=Streptomyces sp. G-G2 TaxID=3046201 RepID=UPI0024B9D671|nr:HAMP domain-containing sensor histidine kinase [Streptomyces sp. G-G2]MDJ0383522.1 HAMP domain-containing sensor histidine kinase [Streptomyces sp. G-G2]
MRPLRAWQRPATLRGRLSLLAVATAAFVTAVFTLAFNAFVHQHLVRQADEVLRARATAIAATVDTSGPLLRVLETPQEDLLDANAWIYQGTRLVERPPSAAAGSPVTREATRLTAQGGPRCSTATHGGAAVRLCARPVPPSGSGRSATVVTALDLMPYQDSGNTLLVASLVLDAVMLACTYAVTRLAVGRALRPVHAMTDEAARWSATLSEERFASVARPAELARLGASLDAFLDRIRAVLRHERQLTSELSHELRNPLATIIAELEWWQSRPRSDSETSTAQTAIGEAAHTMRAICDTLLAEAREDARQVPGTAIVLPVLQALSARAGRTHPVGITVTSEDSRLTAGVSAALLERILSPLLDNALRYAATTVHVRACREAARVRVEVRDDGPGVPHGFRTQLFRPGHRADPGDGHDGAGLGLPLARRLARSAGGEAEYGEPDGGGAVFVVRLPSG